MIVFTMQKIPRGKAKAPKKVQPTIAYNKETLTAHARITKEKLNELKSLKPNNYFEHPFFGKLNLKSSIFKFKLVGIVCV